ncbi:MAG: PQQ-binding-like beta-propeller repeat protein, partial [Planctomycetota bacterium]
MRHIEQGSNARRMTTVAMTFALAPALVSPASGQRFGRRFPERVQESGWSSQRVTSNRGTFSVILDEDRHHKLKKARQHLANGKYEAAIEYLLDVLNSAPSAVYGRGVGSFHGLRRAAREELAKLNEEGRKVYHRLTRTEARPRLEQGLVERDAGGLSLVARLYPHTRAGTRAGLAAGDLFLERGRVLRALREFSFLRNGETGHAVKSRVNLCRALLGLPVTDADLEPGLPLLDGQRTASDWRRLITKLRGLGHDASGYDEDFWPSFGGGMEGNRFASTPADPFKWESRNQIHVPSRVKQSLHAVSNGRKVFIATGTSLYAYDLLTHRTPTWFVESSVLDQSDDFLSATNESMVHSPALGRDLVVAPLQVPLVTDTASRRAVFNGIPIIVPLPVRRLFTFEAETGRLKWSHWEEAGALPGDLSGVPLDVSGPPLVVGDTIFIATHKQLGTIAFYVSAFDLETGAHRWSSLLLSSQIEVNMFGNAHAEFAASPLAYSNGRVYGCTNLGATFSVRADDGSIEWLQSYPIIRIPRARMLPQDR